MVLDPQLNGVSDIPGIRFNATYVVAFCLLSFQIRLELLHDLGVLRLLEASSHLFLAILDSVLLAALCSLWAY